MIITTTSIYMAELDHIRPVPISERVILSSIRSMKSMNSRRAHTLKHHGSDHHEKKRNELMYEELNELMYV